LFNALGTSAKRKLGTRWLRILLLFAGCLVLSFLAASGANGQSGANEEQGGLDRSPIKYVTDPPSQRVPTADFPAQRDTAQQQEAFPYTPSQCKKQFGFACYAPEHIRAAYNVPDNLTGEGQSMAIVVAYGSPTVREDLETFSRAFDLPEPKLNLFYPGGKRPYKPEQHPEQISWAAETSLDVQWAHAIAPGAMINLVVAPNNKGNSINRAQRFVIENDLGEVMSLSFGAAEGSIRGKGNNLHLRQAHKIYEDARTANVSVFAAAGDAGAENGYEVPNALFPASDPLVTAVGGTSLFANDAGEYRDEIVWNDSDPALCPYGCKLGNTRATGGAPSKIFEAPPYQRVLSGMNARTTADVGYNASSYTGVLVYYGFLEEGDGFYFSGGTSAGAPQWAAIAALANQAAKQPLGFLNPTLYEIGADREKYAKAFHDVTIGDNGISSEGFEAGLGYDLPTGLGTPNVRRLIWNLLDEPKTTTRREIEGELTFH
jgi:subtilase family serine protease